MNHFFSFCFDIGRIPRSTLCIAADGLVKSLDYFKNNYTFYLYTDIDNIFTYDIAKNPNVKIIKYEQSNFQRNYTDTWINMSFHKFHMVKEIIHEHGILPIWIDLDTLVCKNIDHLSAYSNFFIMQGSNDQREFTIIPGITVPNGSYIQGNIWKLNRELIAELEEIWNTMPIKPEYDTQGLFNYGYHFKGLKDRMIILGKDIDRDTVSGLEIYNNDRITHPTFNAINTMIYMDDHGRIMHRISGLQLQFMSFTFFTLHDLITCGFFRNLADVRLKNFLSACGFFS